MSNFIFIFKYPELVIINTMINPHMILGDFYDAWKVTLPPPGYTNWYQSQVVQHLWVQPRDFLQDGEPDYSSPLVIIDPISQRRRPLFSV